MRFIPHRVQSEKGQMAVELAAVTPVILMILVIIVDMLIYASECARFDHLAPQSVLSHAVAVASSTEDRREAIESSLEAEFAKNGSWVSVEATDADVVLATMTNYRCVYHFVPWPLGLTGSPPTIEHACALTVDPYTPGELL